VVDAVAPNFTYSAAVESLWMIRLRAAALEANSVTLVAEPATFASVAAATVSVLTFCCHRAHAEPVQYRPADPTVGVVGFPAASERAAAAGNSVSEMTVPPPPPPAPVRGSVAREMEYSTAAEDLRQIVPAVLDSR
jgi:hypothetical protein